MSALPAPTPNQAYCDISALEAGFMHAPMRVFIDVAKEDEIDQLPSLSFLLRHSTNGDTFTFDLGIRKDLENAPTLTLARIQQLGFRLEIPQDAGDSLAKGGLAPPDIKHVCLSHIHFDHVGNSRPYTNATFLAGAAAQPLIANGWPADPESGYSQDVVPSDGRTRFLDPADWPPLGHFPHALDFYGDGSLYIIDAPGHMLGHVNVLARTSADGGWVYLAGDSAHDHRLLTGAAGIAVHPDLGCAHDDKGDAEGTIAKIRKLMETHPRVRVILAHDSPFYKANKGGPAFWPGKIDSL